MAQAVEATARPARTAAVDVDAVRAAGGVVWRTFRGKRQVLIVHRPAYDDWSLPKGKLDAEESEAQAAIREVTEETSVTAGLGPDLGTVTYTDAQGRPKIVRFWQMQVRNGKPAPANEVDDVAWVTFDEAAVRLSYLREREVLRRFQPPPAPGEPVIIHMVRHTKAGDRTLWTGPDTQRPLTDLGHRQADAIASAHHKVPVAKLLSSPSLRCTQTLKPLARRRDLAVETTDTLAEGADPAVALALLAEQARAGSFVASTHGDVMMLGIEALLDQGVRLRGNKVAFKKGCTWELTVVDGTYTGARYRRPPKV
jgi:8-oxo-dGTP pyrophosphatase MutT (NUDIX family)/phosphohistidine phosphatase SixA